jgi:hypothetical protein
VKRELAGSISNASPLSYDALVQGRGAGGPTPGAVLVDVAFGKREPRFVDPPPSWTPVNQGLDDSQRVSEAGR